MAERQSLNATFFAFRRRERGGVLLGASIAYIVLAILVGGAFVFLNAQGIMDYMNWITSIGAHAGAEMDPSKPPALDALMPPPSVLALGPTYLLFLIVHYLLLASYEAACLRWMIRGEAGGLLGLTLNADTWRVYFTYWVWFFLVVAFYIVLALVAGGFIMALLGASSVSTTDNTMGAFAAAAPLLAVAVIAALIFFAVRFAPAAATSVARRRFAFFEAWTVSKGRFWALFGAFVLLFLMFFVLYLIVAGGLGFAMASMMANQVGQGGEPQSAAEALRLFVNPQTAALVGFVVLVMTCAALTLYVALFGINARAALLALEEGKIKAEA